METTTKTMSPAVRAAALKREKKAAAIAARAAGKAAASERRAFAEAAFDELMRAEREALDVKIVAARKGMKVRKNEANPFEIRSMITVWEHEMYFRLCEEREKLFKL